MNTTRRWPYGFLDAFWRFHDPVVDEEISAKKLTNDKELTATVDYVLTTCNLSDREKSIIRLYYQQNMTYREAGREFGISSGRAQQIAVKAIIKLWHNSFYRGILLHGIAAYARQSYKIRMDYEFSRRVDERVDQIRKDERECRKRGLVFRWTGEKKPSGQLTYKSQIADLDLSVRAFNALARSGKRTVADVLELKDKASLLKIKCLGVKSADEILDKLTNKGFDVGHLV